MLRDRLLGEVLKEGQDFLVEEFAGASPPHGAAEYLGARAELRKMKLLGTALTEIINFLLERLEEDQLESVAGLPRSAGDGDREGRGE